MNYEARKRVAKGGGQLWCLIGDKWEYVTVLWPGRWVDRVEVKVRVIRKGLVLLF